MSHPWRAEETRVMVRFVRAILRGGYASAKEALPDSRAALDALRAQARRAGRTIPARTARGVLGRLIGLARAAGRPPRRIGFTAEERGLFARYARLVRAGRYRHVMDAARECVQAHERLRRRAAPRGVRIPERSMSAVFQAVEQRARKLGWSSGIADWTPAEDRVVARFGRGIAVGRYHDALAALPDCRRALVHPGRPLRHTDKGIAARLRRHAHALGRSVYTPWSRDENAVADRFATAVLRGEYPRATAATDDCLRALRHAGCCRRSRAEVRRKLIWRTRTLGREPRYEHWSDRELAILDRFARRLADGRCPSAESAVAPCRRAMLGGGCAARPRIGIRNKLLRRAHALGRPRRDWSWTESELRRLDAVARDYAAHGYPNIAAAADAGLRALGRHRPKGPRTHPGVQHAILSLARKHGRPRSWRLWTPTEERVCDSWVRWYERHRHVRRYKPAQEAARGLQEELQNVGSERTLGACRLRLHIRRLYLHGLAS